jgi:hypothetical protein
MKTTAAALSVLLLPALLGAWSGPGPAKKERSAAVLQAEIEALKPKDHVWRRIPWKTCPLEALKAARTHKRPILTWVFLGIPADERC